MANIQPPEGSSDELTGHYTRQGSKLTGSTTLLLVHRTNTTHAKGDTYVLRVDDTGQRSYVSSLWNTSTAGTYALEYRGTRYHVTLTDTAAEVAPATDGSPKYHNRASGQKVSAS